MSRPPELWAFILANMFLFLISSVLLLLSFYAYYQNPRKSSYRYSTIGFAFIVLGGLVEPVYQLGIRSDYILTGNELLITQSCEGVLLALGLGLLFYAITHHDTDRSTTVDDSTTSLSTNLYELDESRHKH